MNERRAVIGGIGLMGISGGETALACDVCETIGLPLAEFSLETETSLRRHLPGVVGQNPLDVGQSVGRTPEKSVEGMTTIMQDPGVAVGVVLQDMMASLPESSIKNYSGYLQTITAMSERTDKPVILVSTTAEPMNSRLLEKLEGSGIPPIRGLRAGLVAAKALLKWAEVTATAHQVEPSVLTTEQEALRKEIQDVSGALPVELTRRLLASYNVPVVRSEVVKTVEGAQEAASRIGFPLVVKIASPDIAHRSDIDAVKVGIHSYEALREAIKSIDRNVKAKAPQARITGYEIQEELVDCAQAMVGYQAADPYGALTILGSGGVLVELEDDKVALLGPSSPQMFIDKMEPTRLAKVLGGYRNLAPKTDLNPLARLAANISQLANDFSDILPECDLNPVLIRKGTGEVRIVDALFVASGPSEPTSL